MARAIPRMAPVGGSVVLVGPGCVSEKAIDGKLDFPLGRFLVFSGHGGNPQGEFILADGKVFRQVVKDLGLGGG